MRSKKNLRVCYFGSYEYSPREPRNTRIIESLKKNQVVLYECNTPVKTARTEKKHYSSLISIIAFVFPFITNNIKLFFKYIRLLSKNNI